jgi:NAD(P)-dependent dehydrogenase (short-subunit alcohol dehydrogenase family)
MKKIYIIGSSSKLSKALSTLAGSDYTAVFIGRSNPYNLKNYHHYTGVENEASVDILKEIIVTDIASSSNLESASLIVLSGVSSPNWTESFLVNEYLPAKLSQDFAHHVSSLNLNNCSITLISSTAAYQGAKLAYATTKASLTGIVHAISKDFKNAVRINLILPSAFDGNMIADWSDEKRKDVANSNHIGRLGVPDDIAEAILFATSNRFITNSTINMSGGTVHI